MIKCGDFAKKLSGKKQKKSAEKMTEIKIEFPAAVFFSSGVRDFVFSVAKNLAHLSDAWAFRFQSVADELCNNAVEHGSSPDAPVKCIFRFLPKKYFEIEVFDAGTGKKQKSAAEIKTIYERQKSRDAMKIAGIRGRGLSHIVAPIVDEVSFFDHQNGGLSVRVRKKISFSR